MRIRAILYLVACSWRLLTGYGVAQLQALETRQTSANDSVLLSPDTSAPPVTIGQSAGDIEFPEIWHAPFKSGKLSSFKGKLVILNFWATYCSPCIGEMPQLRKLQQHFGDKIQILIIAIQSPEEIDSFYRSRPELKMTTVLGPNVYTTLAHRFAVPTLGTFVWIDGRGIVSGITGFEDVTEPNIQSLLDGQTPSLTLKSALGRARPVNGDTPFMVESNTGGITEIKAHSVLTPFLPGTGGGRTLSIGPGAGTRIRMFNVTPVSLLNEAISGALGRFQKMPLPGTPLQFEMVKVFGPSRTKLEVPDTAALNPIRSENLYCYELILPEARKKDLYKVMLFDIEHYLGLTAVVDTPLVPVFILVKHGDGPKPSSGETPPQRKPLTFFHWNSSAAALASQLEERLKRPVLDETGVTTRFDLSWDDLHIKSVEAIRSELRKNGLDLQEAERRVEMLIVRDKH